MSSLRKFFDAVNLKARYVQLMCGPACQVGSERHQNLISDFIAGVLLAVRSSKHIDVSEATDVKTVLDAVLSDEQCVTVMQAIHAKVNLAGESEDVPRQTNVDFDSHLPERMWQMFRNPDSNPDMNLLAMAEFFVSMGMIACNEATYGLGASLALQAHKTNETELLNYLRTLKK